MTEDELTKRIEAAMAAAWVRYQNCREETVALLAEYRQASKATQAAFDRYLEIAGIPKGVEDEAVTTS